MGQKASTTATIVRTQKVQDKDSNKCSNLYTVDVHEPASGSSSFNSDGGSERRYHIHKRSDEFATLELDLKKAFGGAVPSAYASHSQTGAGGTNQSAFNAWLGKLLANASLAQTYLVKEFLAEQSSGESVSDVDDDDSDSDHDDLYGLKKASQPVMKSSTMSLQTIQSQTNLSDMDRQSSSSDLASMAAPLRDFTLLKVIGKGSFGKVMLVRQNSNGRIFAMKVLYKEQVIKRNQVDHTRTERSVMGYVKHPFIVRLRFAFQSKRKLYLVMDYYAGGELFFHLGRAGRFSEGRARFYAAQIVCALEYLHSKSVVYRDLKPENVLLDSNGYIALTDFGLSREGISDNTSAHSFCGTPEYLAPEILTRAGHGRAADWWSLGALLYEMLTGMPPFYSRSRDRLFQKILESEIRYPRFLSEDAKSLLNALLTRDSNKRLGSVGDAQEVKSHIWFDGIDWKSLLNKQTMAPFKPHVTLPTDTANFDAEFTNLPLDSIGGSINQSYVAAMVGANSLPMPDQKSKDTFAGFSYINNESLPDEEPIMDVNTNTTQAHETLHGDEEPRKTIVDLSRQVADVDLQQDNGVGEIE